MTFAKQIRLAGVPEHFFYPWKKWFHQVGKSDSGFHWSWSDYPGGSGAMLEALEKKETDFAFLLTESVSKALDSGKRILPLSVFVDSPLQWGIFSGSGNPLQSVSPVSERKYAISRFGSGSHLMAKVDALQRGAKIEDSQWIVAGNLEGAKKVLTTREADLFFWEKWTTKPLVDEGIFKMVDVCPGPWASFIVVARPDIEDFPSVLDAFKKVFEEVLAIAAHMKADSQSAIEIAREYGQQEKDNRAWLESVSWVKVWTDPTPELEKARLWIQRI